MVVLLECVLLVDGRGVQLDHIGGRGELGSIGGWVSGLLRNHWSCTFSLLLELDEW